MKTINDYFDNIIILLNSEYQAIQDKQYPALRAINIQKNELIHAIQSAFDASEYDPTISLDIEKFNEAQLLFRRNMTMISSLSEAIRSIVSAVSVDNESVFYEADGQIQNSAKPTFITQA